MKAIEVQYLIAKYNELKDTDYNAAMAYIAPVIHLHDSVDMVPSVFLEDVETIIDEAKVRNTLSVATLISLAEKVLAKLAKVVIRAELTTTKVIYRLIPND